MLQLELMSLKENMLLLTSLMHARSVRYQSVIKILEKKGANIQYGQNEKIKAPEETQAPEETFDIIYKISEDIQVPETNENKEISKNYEVMLLSHKKWSHTHMHTAGPTCQAGVHSMHVCVYVSIM